MPNIVRGGGGGTAGTTPKPKQYNQYAEMADAWNSGNIQKLESMLVSDKYKIETVPGKGRQIVEYVKDPKSTTPKKVVRFRHRQPL